MVLIASNTQDSRHLKMYQKLKPIDRSGGIKIMTHLKSIEILLVEDDPAHIELTSEALKDSKRPVNLTVAHDGVKAMKFLKQEAPYTDACRPDLVILDLNLPRKNGREVLQEIKNDENLRSIPVVSSPHLMMRWISKSVMNGVPTAGLQNLSDYRSSQGSSGASRTFGLP